MKVKTISKSDNVTRVIEFLNMGFEDYLGARVLLNNKLLLQGAILASTSIEKYFKAFSAFNGNICTGHLKKAHLNIIKNFDKNLYSLLNNSFLEFLIKCYKMRYIDNLEPGFTLNIERRQVLAELDFTVSEIFQRFQIRSTQRGKIKLRQKDAIENKNTLLYENNYILLNTPKKQFIEQQDSCYGFLCDPVMGIIEVSYEAQKLKDDGNFLKAGLTKKISSV